MKLMQPPMEFFATRFANQWIRSEESLHKALSAKTIEPESISEALGFFQTARPFKGLSNTSIRQEIAAHLVESSKYLTEKNVVSKVNTLRIRLKERFNTDNYSAASKLLWLRKRAPVIIMDKWAKKALLKQGLKLPVEERESHYDLYCSYWRTIYEQHRKDIEAASRSLVNIKAYCELWDLTNSEIKIITHSNWFHERVFDLYLMHTGK
tara:strand:+ start:222 stop:848 length:627 start_codon:yes stop_codon:yes gene_type:complete